ncbi:MAG: DUF1273 domain-containing protein [Oscillospiraceae bacterium]|nr:DUF1273 domain-containing protein [Oscillospiraceae bacterium]
MTSCCFTGHRYISPDEMKDPQAALIKVLIDLIGQGVRDFYAGGALGFDTMAALVVLKLRKKYRRIRLILLLPCKNQSKGWPQTDQNLYDHILTKADEVVYVSEHYYTGCMQARNRALVDLSDICSLRAEQRTPCAMRSKKAYPSSTWHKWTEILQSALFDIPILPPRTPLLRSSAVLWYIHKSNEKGRNPL